MSEHNQQGTGKHPHKSSEEPYSHTKESGEGRESASREHKGSGEHRDGRESVEERHQHQEEGAHKRAQEIRSEHGHAQK